MRCLLIFNNQVLHGAAPSEKAAWLEYRTKDKPQLPANLANSAWAFQALASIETLPKGDRSSEFERLVARIFKESSAVVSQTLLRSDRGIDMAIWIDKLPLPSLSV